MSSLTNINNNSSVVNVGRTTPVAPGQQKSEKSIPVVLASDQSPVPVVEQNKIQSEVALSLLGIPRSEVALGIFADVNTYDVNPVEWSASPTEYLTGFGVKHLPDEAGALIEAPKDNVTVLTSKRFFRYQPGRVSAATFGIKSTISPSYVTDSLEYDLNPAIRKFGIFDKFDGYYWETQGDGIGDRFCVVRRTQSLLKHIPVEFSSVTTNQTDYGFAGSAPKTEITEINLAPVATKQLTDNKFLVIDNAWNIVSAGTYASYFNTLNAEDAAKCKRDMQFAFDAYILDLQYGGRAHTIVNATTYRTASLLHKAEEVDVHEALGTAIKAFLNALVPAESAAAGRIDAMTTITKAAVNGTQPATPADAWSTGTQRNKLATVFSIYKYYLGYLISRSMPYTADTTFNRSEDEIKYRCLRDVRYVVDGYTSDLQYGGNAATRFNAKCYRFNGLIVESQTNGGVVAEIARHTLLKNLVSSTTAVSVPVYVGATQTGTKTIDSVFTLFGLSSYKTTFDTLANTIITNFTEEVFGKVDFGIAGQYGDLVIYRDNLIMTHAAVNDPSLLLPQTEVVVRVDTTNDTLEAVEGSFVVGQHIRYVGYVDTGDNNTVKAAGGLVSGKVYKVINVSGPKGNIVKLRDPSPLSATYGLGDTDNGVTVDITSVGTITGSADVPVHKIVPVVPFIFPNRYYAGYDEKNPSNPAPFTKPDGSFPYKYSATGTLPVGDNDTAVGYIDTALKTDSVAADLSKLKSQVDEVNLEFNNWIKENVDPKYYAVYEYRVPRSRFSLDQLNGQTNKVVYSDITTSYAGKAYAGQPVKLTEESTQLEATSAWDMDFGKVTMLKVEFSWYGAVGALFLAYVPVANGEARWVRVHHLRCSNQLKIPSLGNATLPITYLVYGGGSVTRLGITDDSLKSYGTPSHHIVKYGASYYIDGGDRGTVRLYSYSAGEPSQVYGERFKLGTMNLTYDSIVDAYYMTIPNSTVDPADPIGSPGVYSNVLMPTDKTYFMHAKVTTSNAADQNVEVIWVDGNKLYLNRSSLNSNQNVTLIANRPSIVFGLKAKENIANSQGVEIRNRVQVYPTKLSTANLGTKPVKLKILKTPYFQPNVTTSGNFNLTANYTITSLNPPLPEASGSYLANDGEYIYGWFRARIGTNNVATVFGRLYRASGNYYFALLQTFSEPVTIIAGINFLPEGRFTSSGTAVTTNSESRVEKERLSSVYISTEIQCPVPTTGTEIATFFLQPGSDHYDLLSYFDYNKDYLSFPLTNQIESLYLAVDTTQYASRVLGNTSNISLADINASLTWEEQ